MTDDRVSPRWVHWRETVNLEEYHLRWQRMEQQGTASHGEADFIEGYPISPTCSCRAGSGSSRCPAT